VNFLRFEQECFVGLDDAAQVAERAPARAAAKALQVVGKAVSISACAITAGAAAARRSDMANERDELIKPGSGMQPIEYLPAPRLVQGGQSGEPTLETGCFRGQLLALATGVGPRNGSSGQSLAIFNVDRTFKKPYT